MSPGQAQPTPRTLAHEALDDYQRRLHRAAGDLPAHDPTDPADRDRIAAIFAYHDALASLEALVGTSLRTR